VQWLLGSNHDDLKLDQACTHHPVFVNQRRDLHKSDLPVTSRKIRPVLITRYLWSFDWADSARILMCEINIYSRCK